MEQTSLDGKPYRCWYLSAFLVVVALWVGQAQSDDTQKYSGQLFQSTDNEPFSAELELTGAERKWLKEHPVLRHGVVDGNKPFEYID